MILDRYLDDLKGHDASIALALLELIHHADDDGCLDRGVWLPPSSYEAMFVSAAHEPDHIHSILAAARASFKEIA